jgi:hypothetical protein
VSGNVTNQTNFPVESFTTVVANASRILPVHELDVGADRLLSHNLSTFWTGRGLIPGVNHVSFLVVTLEEVSENLVLRKETSSAEIASKPPKLLVDSLDVAVNRSTFHPNATFLALNHRFAILRGDSSYFH